MGVQEGYVAPISLQVAPTSRCNLNCVFCSNANREKHEDLDLSSLTKVIDQLLPLGLRTVEWTGGGDPTLYHSINEAIEWTCKKGFEQGFITNGILVKEKLRPYTLSLLKWMRISMNSLDYVDSIDLDFSAFRGTLGFSYVWNEKTNNGTIDRLSIYAAKYNPAYIRIVPDCQATKEEQEENNIKLGQLIAGLGSPFFYQPKQFDNPDRCWWAYVKPFILHDGYVYPCSSVVLNTTSNYTFHKKFRWVHMDDLVDQYKEQSVPLSSSSCDHCVFKSQNDEVESLINPNGMENFV
jgi:MoaA/NifB/PqqE/SkfB family radical SAM enzyme